MQMSDPGRSEETPAGGELVPCGGGDPIPLFQNHLLVGRRSSCDISLTFPNVSSHHCELEFRNGYWWVRDVGSRNGIKVNGQRCDSHWLMPGDVLHIARHQFEVKYEPRTNAPPPEEEDIMSMSLMEKAGLVSRERRPRRNPAARNQAETPSAGMSAIESAEGDGQKAATEKAPTPAPKKPQRDAPESRSGFVSDDELPSPGAPPRVSSDAVEDDPVMQWLSNDSDEQAGDR